ncbi:hypothetical protein [Pedobacter hartonius]|nr:hypothetical protein [Pedobacter hartonius]
MVFVKKEELLWNFFVHLAMPSGIPIQISGEKIQGSRILSNKEKFLLSVYNVSDYSVLSAGFVGGKI